MRYKDQVNLILRVEYFQLITFTENKKKSFGELIEYFIEPVRPSLYMNVLCISTYYIIFFLRIMCINIHE